MKIGILVFSSPSDKVFTPAASADRLVQAGEARGHEMTVLYEPEILDGKAVPELDVIIVRPNFIESAALHTDVLERVAHISSVNVDGNITAAKDKVLQHDILQKAGVEMPKWTVLDNPKETRRAIEEIGFPCIVKVAFGTIGKGIFYAEKMETLQPIIDYLFIVENYPVIIEEFIAESHRTDRRAFVVDGEAVAAYGRKAGDEDVRSNTGIGRTRIEVTLSEEEKELAIRATEALNLEIAGVDLIKSNRGWLVLEVNANPGLKSIEKVSGEDVAGMIIRYAEKKGS